MKTDSFSPLELSPFVRRLIILAFLFLGALIRLFDLTDPPLDFHPTRQLRSAIIARAFYYRSLPSAEEWQRQRVSEQLASHGLLEPPLFEWLVALTYRLLGAEHLWIARLYAILFWLVGSVGIYRLARAMTSSFGALVSLSYYLFLPFGVIASRSFQPDPLMVMLMVFSLWSLYRWYHFSGWRTTLYAGFWMGLAVFVKAVALFPLIAALVALSLVGKGWRKTVRDGQVWAIFGLSLLPVLSYYLIGVLITGSLRSQVEGSFFPQMWFEPAFYVRWVDMVNRVVGFGAMIAALLGIGLFAQPWQRGLVSGLWLGYLLYGLVFPYHITTHSYYHLFLIPIIALSLSPVADLIARRLISIQPKVYALLLFFGVLVLGIVVEVWEARVSLARQNFHQEPAYWQEIADRLGRDASVVALTHDYGNRLAYYGWITPRVWLPTGHLEGYRELRGGSPREVKELFEEMIQGQDYFLVTLLNQFNNQPGLERLLYENYPIFAQGDGYIIFDLHKPIR